MLEGSVLLCGPSGTDPTAIFVFRRAGASRKSLIFSTFASRGLQLAGTCLITLTGKTSHVAA